jgi:hypothetical protein
VGKGVCAAAVDIRPFALTNHHSSFIIHLLKMTIGIATRSRTPTKSAIITAISFLVMAVLPFVVGDFQISLLSKLLLYGALAISLDLVWGFTGILSFAHGVFFTLGGYAMAYPSSVTLRDFLLIKDFQR